MVNGSAIPCNLARTDRPNTASDSAARLIRGPALPRTLPIVLASLLAACASAARGVDPSKSSPLDLAICAPAPEHRLPDDIDPARVSPADMAARIDELAAASASLFSGNASTITTDAAAAGGDATGVDEANTETAGARDAARRDFFFTYVNAPAPFLALGESGFVLAPGISLALAQHALANDRIDAARLSLRLGGGHLASDGALRACALLLDPAWIHRAPTYVRDRLLDDPDERVRDAAQRALDATAAPHGR